jgi:hypothetical protein
MKIAPVTSTPPIESPIGTKTLVGATAYAAFSATVNGKTYSSTVEKSDGGYDATAPIAPPVTVHGDSPQQVERVVSQLVDYYA